MWLLAFPLLLAAWFAFCWLINWRTRPSAAPVATDPGHDAIATATGPSPYPTGRHRAPGGAL